MFAHGVELVELINACSPTAGRGGGDLDLPHPVGGAHSPVAGRGQLLRQPHPLQLLQQQVPGGIQGVLVDRLCDVQGRFWL